MSTGTWLTNTATPIATLVLGYGFRLAEEKYQRRSERAERAAARQVQAVETMQRAAYDMVRAVMDLFRDRRDSGSWVTVDYETWRVVDRPARAVAVTAQLHVRDERLRSLTADIIDQTAKLGQEADPQNAIALVHTLKDTFDAFSDRCREVVADLA